MIHYIQVSLTIGDQFPACVGIGGASFILGVGRRGIDNLGVGGNPTDIIVSGRGLAGNPADMTVNRGLFDISARGSGGSGGRGG